MRKKILIVDDEPQIVELIQVMLGDEYEYFEAHSGNEALEKAVDQQPDLILLDIMMPDMDGYQVCQRLRTDQRTKNIVIAMVSAKKDDHDILQGIDVGAIAYITKPFDGFELSEKVKELLEVGS